MPTDKQPGVKSPSAARERFQARAKKSPPTRPASPTRAIEPGLVHHRIARGVLTGAQARVKDDMGITLDVGEFPEDGTLGTENEDPQQIEKLTAHLVARLGDRFTVFRKLSRHLEGKENRAGLLSDVAAVAVALYKRNPDVFEDLSSQFVSGLKARRMAQRASRNGSNQPPGGVTSNAA